MTAFEFKAIGTSWHIDIYEELGAGRAAELLSRIKERIDRFERAYSRFRDDSVVAQAARAAGTYRLPDDAERMLAVYRDLYVRTGGFFTPLVGGMLADAGYDAAYSLRQKRALEAPPAWGEALEYRRPDLIVKKPVRLDFGAAGKGYLIDLVGELLAAEGVSAYLIDAGGDILYKSKEGGGEGVGAPRGAARIGLEDPQDASKAIGVCALSGGSVCGSAGNRRAWGDFTHIMDPKRLSSPKGVLAVWVMAESALVADALTTCLFFVPAASLSGAYDFQYVLMRSDRSVEKSAHAPVELFLEAR